MDYTISLAPNGNEVTTWDFPQMGHGDTAECHAEPPICGCVQICEAIDSASDADFGFWDEVWGPPDVQEFPCEDPATVSVEHEGQTYHLCDRHAR